MKYEADMMDQRRLGRAEGRAEGRAQGLTEFCDRMIRPGYSDEQIAGVPEVPETQIADRRKQLL